MLEHFDPVQDYSTASLIAIEFIIAIHGPQRMIPRGFGNLSSWISMLTMTMLRY